MLEVERPAEALEQALTGPEHDRRHDYRELVDIPAGQSLTVGSAPPVTNTCFSPAAALARSMAFGTRLRQTVCVSGGRRQWERQGPGQGRAGGGLNWFSLGPIV